MDRTERSLNGGMYSCKVIRKLAIYTNKRILQSAAEMSYLEFKFYPTIYCKKFDNL